MTVKSRRLAASALIVALGAATIFLSADRVSAATIFDVTGTFADASTISGTLTIDLTTGHVDAANVSYLGATYATILVQGSDTHTPVPVYYGVNIGVNFGFPFLALAVPQTSAANPYIGYVGGALCSVDSQCGPDQNGDFWVSAYNATLNTHVVLETGQLTAATPLPAALPLFATGLGALGLLGWRRKRKQTVSSVNFTTSALK
jgi:hypothetical protein